MCLRANDEEDLNNLILLSALYKELTLAMRWIVDSAASNHFISCLDNLLDYHQITPVRILTGSGIIWGLGKGDILLESLQGARMLRGVIFVPDLKCNALLSVTQLMKEGMRLIFEEEGCKIERMVRGEVEEFLLGTLIGKTIYVDLYGRYPKEGVNNEKKTGINEKGRVHGKGEVGERIDVERRMKKCEETGVWKREEVAEKYEEVAMLHGSKDVQPLDIWYKRLGYINQDALIKLQAISTGMEFGPA